MAGEYRGGARVTLVPENGAPSKSFEFPSGEDREGAQQQNPVSAKEGALPWCPEGTSWFHAELRLLAPELRGSSGALVKVRDTSTNGIGLKAPGTSTIRLSKGADHPVPDGSLIIIPFKVKAEDGKSPDELRTTVKVMVSKLGDPGLGAPPGNWSTSADAGISRGDGVRTSTSSTGGTAAQGCCVAGAQGRFAQVQWCCSQAQDASEAPENGGATPEGGFGEVHVTAAGAGGHQQSGGVVLGRSLYPSALSFFPNSD
eukprot:s324_g13.t1